LILSSDEHEIHIGMKYHPKDKNSLGEKSKEISFVRIYTPNRSF
jgi:hypothetical protein